MTLGRWSVKLFIIGGDGHMGLAVYVMLCDCGVLVAIWGRLERWEWLE